MSGQDLGPSVNAGLRDLGSQIDGESRRIRSKPLGIDNFSAQLAAERERITLEARGFFPVAGQWLGRAARAVADASIRTVDRVGYGYSLLWQHANNLVGQMPSLARPGERVQDQPGWELPQAIHPVSAATGAPDADVLDVAHSLGIVDNASDIRKAQSEKLGNWEASAAIAGELASYAIPGTPIHGIGAGLGNLARNAVGMALPASRYLKALVDKGTITADRAEEIARSGNVLYEIAKHESSGLAVKTLAKAPSFAGDYAAMLGQSYASAPAPEADDVLKHTALMAPMFLGIGRVAQMASSRIAEATLSDAGKRAMLDLYAATQKGKTPGLWKTIAALPGADKAKILSTELMLAGAEGTAFTATNIEAYNALLDAYAGKPGSWNQFMQTWSGTMAGTLFNKGVPWAELPYFKRVRPDLNSYQTILDQEAAAARAKQEARDETTKRGVEAAKLYGEARAAADKEFDANVQMESRAIPENDRTIASFVDPLLRSASGLVVEHAAVNQPIPEVKVVDPSGASVALRIVATGNVGSRTVEPQQGEVPTIRPTEPEAFVDVSRKAWNAVRPGEPMPDGPLTGSDANRFLNDLGIHLVGQSARGTLIFGGRLGMLENSAGGGWRDPGKGRDYTFGLDGEPLFRDVMDKRWRPLEETDPVRWMMDEPVGALGGDQSFWHPAMDEWARFLHQKARAYPNPEVDSLLAIVMNVAQYGGNSKPADEARNFLLSVEPALVAQAMTQGNEKAIAHTIAATAAGLSNHQEAQRLIAEAARLGSRDRALVKLHAEIAPEPVREAPPAPVPQVPVLELQPGGWARTTPEHSSAAGAKDVLGRITKIDGDIVTVKPKSGKAVQLHRSDLRAIDAQSVADHATMSRRANASKAAKERQRVRTDDDVLSFIAKQGGISHEAAKQGGKQFTDERGRKAAGVRRVFTEKGMDWDRLAQNLVESGYLDPNAEHGYGVHAAQELVARALAGEPVMSQEGYQAKYDNLKEMREWEAEVRASEVAPEPEPGSQPIAPAEVIATTPADAVQPSGVPLPTTPADVAGPRKIDLRAEHEAVKAKVKELKAAKLTTEQDADRAYVELLEVAGHPPGVDAGQRLEFEQFIRNVLHEVETRADWEALAESSVGTMLRGPEGQALQFSKEGRDLLALLKKLQRKFIDGPESGATPQEPAKTEPPPEVGITELFGGIPLKGVGDALRRFADLVVSGDPDAAQGRARERAAAEDQPKPGFGVKDKYAANIGEVVGRYGGEVGKQIEADVFMANNAYREVQGKLAESGYFDDVRKMAGRKGYSEAAKWLDTEVADPQQEGTTTSRRNLLLEGIAVDEPTPPKAQELLDAYGKAFHLLGQEAESAGIVRPNREGGYERFRAREPGRTLATRTDTTEAYRDIVERPFDPRSAEALRQIALHPRNKMSPEQADAWIKRVQDEWSKAKTAPNDVKSLMEVRRELPFLPDTVTVQGEKIRLREKSGAVAMAKMVEAGLRSIRSHIAFGPDIPKAAKEALGDKSLGPTETLRRYAEATGNDTKAQEALQVLLNRVEGRSEDPFFPKWGGRSRKLLRDLETATRVAMISGSYKQNFVEAIGTGSHLTGMQRGVPAMLKAGFSPVATLHEAARVGAVMHGVHGTDITMHNGVLKAVTAVMGLPHSASQSFAEATAYAMVKSYADSIRKNGIDAVAESRMRMVGMPELVIAKAKENFTPDMEAAFVRAAVREMTGSKTPTEGSYYASNPKFQTLFAFNKWFTSRLRGLFKVGDEMFKAWKSGDASAKYAATLNAIQFAAGSTVAGMIGSYLGMVMKEQSFEEAYDRIMRELAVDGVPYGLLKLGFAPSLIGGVLGSMARSALDPNMSAAEQVASLTTPGARATQLIAMAKGEGSYRDQDAGSRIITSLERIAPISGDLKAIGAVMGLTEQEGPFRAANSAKYRAMRDLGYPIPTGGGEDPEDVPFHTAMRKLDQFIKERAATKTAKEIVQEPEFTDLAREALGVGQGKDIAASLLARQSLSGFDEQRLEKIRQRVGDANMGVLFAHDRAMEVLAKAFRKEKGTDRHLYPPIAERLDSAEEMVRLGDTGGVWKPIYTEVMEEAVAAVRSGVRPSHDLRRAAISMSRHPESLRGIVSDEKIAVLRRVSAARAAQLLERFFLESVERRLTR